MSYYASYQCYSNAAFEPSLEPSCVACGFCNDLPSSIPAVYKLIGWPCNNAYQEGLCKANFPLTETQCSFGRVYDSDTHCVRYFYNGCGINVPIGGNVFAVSQHPPVHPKINGSCNLSGTDFQDMFSLYNSRGGAGITWCGGGTPIVWSGSCGKQQNGKFFFQAEGTYASLYPLGTQCLIWVKVDLTNWVP